MRRRPGGGRRGDRLEPRAVEQEEPFAMDGEERRALRSRDHRLHRPSRQPLAAGHHDQTTRFGAEEAVARPEVESLAVVKRGLGRATGGQRGDEARELALEAQQAGVGDEPEAGRVSVHRDHVARGAAFGRQVGQQRAIAQSDPAHILHQPELADARQRHAAARAGGDAEDRGRPWQLELAPPGAVENQQAVEIADVEQPELILGEREVLRPGAVGRGIEVPHQRQPHLGAGCRESPRREAATLRRSTRRPGERQPDE